MTEIDFDNLCFFGLSVETPLGVWIDSESFD